MPCCKIMLKRDTGYKRAVGLKRRTGVKEILIIDDDISLCNLIKKCLSMDGYFVDVANNGLDGYKKIVAADNLSLVLLDIMLPDFDGFQILEMIREKYTVPILMLTAKSDDYSKIQGLKNGADDYLTKPFNINELRARAEAIIRRYTEFNSKETGSSNVIVAGDIEIDKENRIVRIGKKIIELTTKEFDLLFFLVSNRGRIFTKKQIYMNVWENEYLFDDGNIMSFISKLRKKIEPNPDEPIYILTVRGVGYRFSK